VSVFECFPAPSVMVVIILARGSQSYPSAAPASQGGVGITVVRLSASIPLFSSRNCLSCLASLLMVKLQKSSF
jgi:hypothetical protein